MRDIKVGLLVCLCLAGVAIFAAWPVILIVSPILIIALASLIVVGVIAVSVQLLTRGIAPLVDAVFDWRMKQKQLEAMGRMINDAGAFVSGAGNITAAAYPRLPAPALNTTDYAPSLPAPRPALIETIAPMDCVLFIGTRGRGKTTNMLRLMEARRGTEIVKVFDTHAEPNKWLGAPVIGSELGMTEDQRLAYIWAEMMKIVTEMNSRLEVHRSKPGARFEPTAIYIDEYTNLPRKIETALGVDMAYSFTEPILNEGRKVRINFVWGCHSDRASALGLTNRYDLLGSFDAIVKLHKTPDDRFAIVNFGDGYLKDKPFSLADPYADGVVIQSDILPGSGRSSVIDGEYAPTTKPATIMIPAMASCMPLSKARPTGQAQTICQMYAEGCSFNEISRAINNGATGGKQTAIIKGILSNHGKL